MAIFVFSAFVRKPNPDFIRIGLFPQGFQHKMKMTGPQKQQP